MFEIALAISLLYAAFVWLSYMALEPYVRRRWPGLLISWARLSSGKFRDPLVGRDLLAGAMVGTIGAGLTYLDNALPYWINVQGHTPIPPYSPWLSDPMRFAGIFVFLLRYCVVVGLADLGLLFLVRILVRKNWLAIGITGLLFTARNLGGENIFLDLPYQAILSALALLVLIRFGLLAFVAYSLAGSLSILAPITLRLSYWYAGRSVFVLLLVIALTLYGFRTALAGRPVFGKLALDD